MPPRMTRAALRILEDEQNLAADTPLPATPQRDQRERAPLGDITGSQAQSPMIRLEVNLEKPAKKKGKKGKSGKKGSKKVQGKENGEVAEDDSQSDESAAVEAACEKLMNGSVEEVPLEDTRAATPPSPAVISLMKHLSPPKTHTPRFDPEIHRTPETKSRKDEEDSFVGTIGARTPMVHNSAEGSPLLRSTESSPRLLRIEDSVEALDMLNEAVEKMSEQLPVVPAEPAHAEDIVVDSVSKSAVGVKAVRSVTQPTTKPKAGTLRKKPVAAVEALKKEAPIRSPMGTIRNARAASTPRLTVLKPTPPKASKPTPIATKRSPTKTSPITKEPTKPTATIKPRVSSTTTTTKPRVSSITKAPFVPTKSTKPPTTSTFTLPGAAISAKLKAQREERQKREEENAREKREFKAKPVPRRISSAARPEVKMTATAAARIDLAANKAENAKTPTATTRPSMGAFATEKREKTKPYGSMRGKPPTLAITKRASDAPAKPCSTSAATTRRPSTLTSRLSSAPRVSSIGTTLSTPPTRTTRKSTGREIFARGMVAPDIAERERKAKEEAAKKARQDAAERGRAASRKWAEERARKLAGGGGGQGMGAVAA